MSNTKQQKEEKYLPIIIGFLYGIQSDFLTKGEVKHRVAAFKRTKGYQEAVEAIDRLVTEAKIEIHERYANVAHVAGNASSTITLKTLKDVALGLKAELQSQLTNKDIK